MFDRAIIETDNFLDLPTSCKALYFLLGMEADDEGFVSPKRVTRLYGGSDDDIKILSAKNFVIPFESGVVVITDWNENNYLDSNRIKPTRYKEEKNKILTQGKRYVLNNSLTGVKPEERSIEENRTEKECVSSKKNRYSEFKNVFLTVEERKKVALRFGEKNTLNLIDQLGGYIEQSGKKYKSHYAVLLGWGKKKEMVAPKNHREVELVEVDGKMIAREK